MSERGEDWKAFSDVVLNHIENYTVPQYGDKGKDQITGYSIGDCVTNIKKYANRYGTNARDGQQLLDFMKMAHYAQCSWTKEKESVPNVNKKVISVRTGNTTPEFIEDLDKYLKGVLASEGKVLTITVEE